MSGNSTSQLYLAYGNAGFSVALFAPLAVRTLIACAGLVCNFALVFVTVRSAWLHDRTNVLLALYASCQSVFELSNFVSLVPALTGSNFVSVRTCFQALAVPTAMFCSSFVLMLSIAVDRLLSTLLPIRHKLISSGAFLGATLCCCSLYAAYIVFLAMGVLSASAQVPVVCSFSSMLQLKSTSFSAMNIAFECTSGAVYLLIWLKLRKSAAASASGGRIFKSLLAIIVVEICGLCITSGTVFALKALQVGDLPSFFIQTPVTCLAVVSSGASAVILFLFSLDYRRAFVEQFPLLKSLAEQPNLVGPAATMVVVPTAKSVAVADGGVRSRLQTV